MKIRTQLVLACFVLSVLPLSAIVLYSYQSSRRALESAYQQEAQRLLLQVLTAMDPGVQAGDLVWKAAPKDQQPDRPVRPGVNRVVALHKNR